jgi:hypothetical protein
MLTLSSLAQHSNGIILTHNGALAATCQQPLGTERPTFGCFEFSGSPQPGFGAAAGHPSRGASHRRSVGNQQ